MIKIIYPIWYVSKLSAGLILGLIATFHILPSHLVIGAIWFLVYIEWIAVRKNDQQLYSYIKKYSLLLLVFSYVFGSISGVGIWFASTLVSPKGISALIHNYVWGWATEWTFFIIEVTAIFVYYYLLDKIDKKSHLKIGIIFAIASWFTMVIIVGILSFMLSPGKWLQNGSFFSGFFNQTYWPQLLLRTSLMLIIAALYGLIIASRFKENLRLKTFIVKRASIWGIIGIILSYPFTFLYVKTLPKNSLEVMEALVSKRFLFTLIFSSLIVFLYLIFSLLKPKLVKTVPSIVAILILFTSIWTGERIREILRKPYVISNYMYSNQIIVNDLNAKGVKSEIDDLNKIGILTSAK